MRKLVFISFIVLGAAVGLFSALQDAWGLKAVMMTIGVVVGTVLGGALTITGRRSRSRADVAFDDAFDGTPLEELDRNHQRDKNHSPLMKPWNAELDHHMFDPDRHD